MAGNGEPRCTRRMGKGWSGCSSLILLSVSFTYSFNLMIVSCMSENGWVLGGGGLVGILGDLGAMSPWTTRGGLCDILRISEGNDRLLVERLGLALGETR